MAENRTQAIDKETIKVLIEKACEMLQRSYIPYSHFAVGAALLTADGKIYTGCNIENAAFAPTNCAERTAIFKAVSEGELRFKAIAIVGGRNRIVTDFVAPCGVCRQVMAEFCDPDDFMVITAKTPEDYRVQPLGYFLPEGFTPKDVL